MRERPILFSGPMVRAILAGTKTQTRRPAPIKALSFTHHPQGLITWAVQFMKAVKGVLASYSGGTFTEKVARSIIASQFCPFGEPGDRLWVRETWGQDEAFCEGMQYRASWPEEEIQHAAENSEWRWRPSIHMPRGACRLVLEIVSVRVERLQEISEAGALAEGPEPATVGYKDYAPRCGGHEFVQARDSFHSLWDSIYAAKGQGWDANPWVWVVEFKRAEASS
jgi:hypothetical protein